MIFLLSLCQYIVCISTRSWGLYLQKSRIDKNRQWLSYERENICRSNAVFNKGEILVDQ